MAPFGPPSCCCVSGARPAAVGEGTAAAASSAAPRHPQGPVVTLLSPPLLLSAIVATTRREQKERLGGTKTAVRARGAQSSGAVVIARGAQTVWPSPPVHRPTGTRLSGLLRPSGLVAC